MPADRRAASAPREDRQRSWGQDGSSDRATQRQPWRSSGPRRDGAGRAGFQRGPAGRPGGGPRRRPEVQPIPTLDGPNAFVDLGVPEVLAAMLAAGQITDPTPIQLLAIPAGMAGRDLLGRGRTGSGKTLAFGLPLLTRVAAAGPAGGRAGSLRGLVLAPTRELAMQVADVLRPLAGGLGLRTQLVIGGASYDKQLRGLARADIVVATPGRLVDLMGRGAVELSGVNTAVIDEADHMADLGFADEVDTIMSRLDPDAQVMLFSATLDGEVGRLIQSYLHNPIELSADPATAMVDQMRHRIVLVHPKDKDAVTADLARLPARKVAFVRTQLGADRLAGQLSQEGIRAAALHGGMKQGARTATLADFRRGLIDVLVATDVAARGIHVDAVDLVLHVDPPHGPKEYLHRSGRTARAGATGTVISLATLRQAAMVNAITSKAGVAAPVRRTRPGDPDLSDVLRSA